MEGPLVIILDDLHWADEASLNLLLSLSELAGTHAILFICMLRPDKTVSSWDSIQTIQEKLEKQFDAIVLEPLQEGQTNAMLTNLLGVEGLPENLRTMIFEKAGGNPFFIEEIIRSLIETNQLIRENGHWKAAGAEAKISLPNTLRGVLSSRIDRLPESSRHVLQEAAVIGRLFDLRVLKRLTGLNGGLEPHIQYLTEVSLIEALLGEYAFRHVLIQEAAYESILLKRRAELHRQIAETFEDLHQSRIEEFAPLLAHHFYSAGDARSLKYDQMAGEKSARLYANAEAATHFRRALEVARREKLEPDRVSQLFTQLGSVLELSGRFDQALEAYNGLQSFGKEQGLRAIEMKALMAKATIYSIFSQMHDSNLSEQVLKEALEISREIGDIAAQARLNWNLMLTFLFSKRLDQALGYGEAALVMARKSEDREQLAFVLNDLCRLYTCRGEFDKAHASIREARELWESLDHQVMLADSLGSEAEAYFNAGEYEQSLEYSWRALHICEQINNLWGQSYDLMLMSFSYFENGQLGRGIDAAGRSNHLADEAGLIASSISMRSELAWVYAYCGAPEKGYPLIERALQVAEVKQPAWKSFPLSAKVRMELLRGDLPAAEQTTGGELLQATSIPYARYTIFVCLANIELASARRDFAHALSLCDELLAETAPLTRVDIPEVLRWRASALVGLGRSDEAQRDLTQARARARESDSNLHLWLILSDLAEINQELGDLSEAGTNRAAARQVIERIADSLQEVGLRDPFLNQPRVRKLMR